MRSSRSKQVPPPVEESREVLLNRIKSNPAYKLWLSGVEIQKRYGSYLADRNIRQLCLYATEVLHLNRAQIRKRDNEYRAIFQMTFPDPIRRSDALFCIQNNWRAALAGSRKDELEDIRMLMKRDGHADRCMPECLSGMWIKKFLAASDSDSPVCREFRHCRRWPQLRTKSRKGSNRSQPSTIATGQSGYPTTSVRQPSAPASLAVSSPYLDSHTNPVNYRRSLLPLGNAFNARGMETSGGLQPSSLATKAPSEPYTAESVPPLPRRSSKRPNYSGWSAYDSGSDGNPSEKHARYNPVDFYDPSVLSTAVHIDSRRDPEPPSLPLRSKSHPRVAPAVAQHKEAPTLQNGHPRTLRRAESAHSSAHHRHTRTGGAVTPSTQGTSRPRKVTAGSVTYREGTREPLQSDCLSDRPESLTLNSAIDLKLFPKPPTAIPSIGGSASTRSAYEAYTTSIASSARSRGSGSSTKSPFEAPRRKSSLGRTGRRDRGRMSRE
jgi:hypothetical protein